MDFNIAKMLDMLEDVQTDYVWTSEFIKSHEGVLMVLRLLSLRLRSQLE